MGWGWLVGVLPRRDKHQLHRDASKIVAKSFRKGKGSCQGVVEVVLDGAPERESVVSGSSFGRDLRQDLVMTGMLSNLS